MGHLACELWDWSPLDHLTQEASWPTCRRSKATLRGDDSPSGKVQAVHSLGPVASWFQEPQQVLFCPS